MVQVPVDGEALGGDLVVPTSARAVVLFGAGTGAAAALVAAAHRPARVLTVVSRGGRPDGCAGTHWPAGVDADPRASTLPPRRRR
ncbi:hypothetical protein [Streptomyces sp. 2A115]|uniref:hypothetical protein n=1 Tax=Streptomyces sp. 2A115 TaxID=3457439 RepID=UPI003FD17D68